jgi:hypothetical protein
MSGSDCTSPIKAARGRNGNGHAGHHYGVGLLRAHRHNAGLQGEKVGETAAIEGDGCHRLSPDHSAELGANGFDGNRIHFGDRNRLLSSGQCQGHVRVKCTVEVDYHASAFLCLKAGGFD